MFTLYTFYKFLHLAAVIIWLGGFCTLSLLNLRLTREQNPATLRSLLNHAAFYGRAVIGPAMAFTLVAGILTAINAGYNFGSTWISWGFVAILGSVLLGIFPIRMVTTKLNQLVTSTSPDPAPIHAVQTRLALLNLLNLLLLLSAVGAMIFKPA